MFLTCTPAATVIFSSRRDICSRCSSPEAAAGFAITSTAPKRRHSNAALLPSCVRALTITTGRGCCTMICFSARSPGSSGRSRSSVITDGSRSRTRRTASSRPETAPITCASGVSLTATVRACRKGADPSTTRIRSDPTPDGAPSSSVLSGSASSRSPVPSTIPSAASVLTAECASKRSVPVTSAISRRVRCPSRAASTSDSWRRRLGSCRSVSSARRSPRAASATGCSHVCSRASCNLAASTSTS